MKKPIYLLLLLLNISFACSSDKDNADNNVLANYKIEYTTDLSDADSNFEISVITTDDGGNFNFHAAVLALPDRPR